MRSKLLAGALACLSAIAGLAERAAAENARPTEDGQPLWELGVTGIALVSPDYPGADEYQYLALPLPNIIYRGDFLRADRQGVRGVFFESDDLEINVSVDGNLPTDDDSDARAGMPDLDPLVELGPSLDYTFLRNDGGAYGIRLPLRLAFSVFGDDSFVQYQGIVANPEVTFQTRVDAFDRGVGIELSTGPILGYDGINEYFYDVDPEFARSGRAAYASDSGYMGMEATGRIGFSLTDRARYFAAGNVMYLGGAANEDSPLLRDEFNVTFVTGLTWSLYVSDARVPRARR